MSSSVSITLARPADARDIAEMSRDCVETGLGWSWTPPRVLHAIRDRATNVVVARGGAGELLGFGIMPYGDQRAHLSLLAVRAASRGQGVGRELLGWLEKCAVTAGLEGISLEVRRDNPGAVEFYRRCGYELAGTVPGYYSGVLDALRLAKTLWTPTGQPAD
ncbi:GNAT family N-acetyltransferase [Caenimonas aquaedulcis]|uniref:GNAT family N-acetyltransferase n=1 Tax=Caenimonas aquaedulcis TaxID=2793270 RepID=A0A931MII7_9BURK|nr:N-acetyltransferase [Caenimonas aquaedulcis]MBG9390181.1 GNAT family N-acetyltransferase [Caenimonas aquaedulcis]